MCFPTPATAAKMKVKSMLGGGGGNAKQPAKSGGIGGLFPSSRDSGDNGKEKKGGLFGGLLSTPQGDSNPGGVPGGVPGGAAGSADSKLDSFYVHYFEAARI